MGLNTVLWRKKPDLGHKRLPQINKQSSDFDEIWHTNADLERDYGRMTKYKKNLKILYGGRRLYKSFFWPQLDSRLSNVSEILRRKAKWHDDGGRMTKTQFRKSKVSHGRHVANR